MIIYLKGIIQRLIFDTLEGSLFEFFNTYREKKLMAGFTCLPAFRKNGVLFTNYEARNGSVFGLKKAALCFGLADENIQTSVSKKSSKLNTN